MKNFQDEIARIAEEAANEEQHQLASILNCVCGALGSPPHLPILARMCVNFSKEAAAAIKQARENQINEIAQRGNEYYAEQGE